MLMMPPDIDHQIWQSVVHCFAEALCLDDDEVRWEARVIDDLGAESLDLLDIAFRLERTFDIKIPRGGVQEEARDELEDGIPYEIDGVLTDRGLAALAAIMPEVPAEEIVPGLKSKEIPLLFRVGTFYRIVEELRAGRDASAAK